jgi:uncharacterized protein (DUF427 family)
MTEHTIDISPADATVLVRDGDTVLAETDAALVLHEVGKWEKYYHYVPREHVNFDALEARENTTTCSLKGEASEYWVLADRPEAGFVAWSYPDPTPGAAPIKGYIAFYDDVVDVAVTARA